MTRPTTLFDRVTAADNAIGATEHHKMLTAARIAMRCTCEHNAELVAQYMADLTEIDRLTAERIEASEKWIAAEFGESA